MAKRTTMLGIIIQQIVNAPTGDFGALSDLMEKLNSDQGYFWGKELRKFLQKQATWAEPAESEFWTRSPAFICEGVGIQRRHIKLMGQDLWIDCVKVDVFGYEENSPPEDVKFLKSHFPTWVPVSFFTDRRKGDGDFMTVKVGESQGVGRTFQLCFVQKEKTGMKLEIVLRNLMEKYRRRHIDSIKKEDFLDWGGWTRIVHPFVLHVVRFLLQETERTHLTLDAIQYGLKARTITGDLLPLGDIGKELAKLLSGQAVGMGVVHHSQKVSKRTWELEDIEANLACQLEDIEARHTSEIRHRRRP